MHSGEHSARVISPDWQNPALDLVWPIGFTPSALDDAQFSDMIRNLSDGMH